LAKELAGVATTFTLVPTDAALHKAGDCNWTTASRSVTLTVQTRLRCADAGLRDEFICSDSGGYAANQGH
jgi:hypothetical protein